MWAGRKAWIVRGTFWLLLPWLAVGAWAQAGTPMDCEQVWSVLEREGPGYALTQVGSRVEAGWCVLIGASLRAKAADKPNITVEGLRARRMTRDGAFRELEVQATGLRVTPKLGDTGMDARLQSFLRLTVADLAFLAHWNAQAEVLELRGVRLVVPGRMDLTLGADIAGADPAAGLSVLLGAGLTSLDLRVVTDGTMARPVMEAVGERMLPEGAERFAAVTAAKPALAGIVTALPGDVFTSGKAGLDALVAALPQAVGELTVALRSAAGISAARLALAGLQDDPSSAAALARLLQGVAVTVNWRSGVAVE